MKFKLGEFLGNFGLPVVVIGVGTLVLVPLAAPALAKVGKPVTKAVIKAGIRAYEGGKLIFAEAQEAFEDLLAESKAELAEEATQNVITIEASEAS